MQGRDDGNQGSTASRERKGHRPTTRERWIYIVGAASDIEPDPPVRRRAARYDLAYGSALVRFRHPGHGRLLERTCNVLEVSITGLMLRSRDELPEQTSLYLEACVGEELAWLRGTVMHCTTSVGAYKVGVRLDFEG
jgi:hypothetical protein